MASHPAAATVGMLVAGYVVLVEVLLQLVFGRIDVPLVDAGFVEVGLRDRSVPREIFLGGAVIGCLYGLIAVGLILVYRASRIVNFAQAQLGAVPATLALLLITARGWSYWAVVPIVLLGPLVLGAVVERTVIRRFSSSPRLILTVATIGVSFVLLVVDFVVKSALAGDLAQSATADLSTPFESFTFAVGTQIFSGDDVLVVAVTVVAAASLAAFFRWTDVGIAVRAAAENADRARLLGIPVAKVSTLVWMIAAVLSSIGVFLRAPIVGLPLTGFIGPSLLLYGLAAAVMARMDRVGAALVAGMFIGCVDRTAVFSTRTPALANAAMVVVILVALAVQRKSLSRAFDSGVSSFRAIKEIRPIPIELRHEPRVRLLRRAGAIGAAVVVVAVPVVLSADDLGRATLLLIYAMVGVSMVILTGWSGQISLGQWAIAGVGAAVAGGLAVNHRADFFVAVAVAGLAGALVSIVVGVPALRIQGLFLAVTTLAAAFTIQTVVLSDQYFAWLLPPRAAFVERPVLYGVLDLDTDTAIGPFRLTGDGKYYLVVLAALAVVLWIGHSMRELRSGRILIGVRENNRLMQAFGVDLARTRLVAFAISGFIAGIAGALFAYQQRSVSAASFPPETSILLFVMVVIGGASTLTGAVIGAVYLVGIPLLPWIGDFEHIDLLTSGLGLLALLLVVPGGLAEVVFRIRDRWLRSFAADRGIHVPSLVADSRVAPGSAS